MTGKLRTILGAEGSVFLFTSSSSGVWEGAVRNLVRERALFAARGDYPLIRRNPAGRRYEARKPKSGELLRRTSEQLDYLLDAVKRGELALAGSPADIVGAKKSGTPCAGHHLSSRSEWSVR